MNTLVDHKVSRETLFEALSVLGIPRDNTVEVVIGMTSIEVTQHYLDSDGHTVVDYDDDGPEAPAGNCRTALVVDHIEKKVTDPVAVDLPMIE